MSSADVGVSPAETVGAVGGRPRWSVSPWGAVAEWGSGHDPSVPERTLEWYVAADDRWHVPPEEPTARQQRVGGVPVVETRLRVPDGDVVQRVWAVPDRGGLVVMEVENASPLPLAVAVVGPDIVTERPPADVPVQGIDLPGDAIVLPVGHHSTVRVVQPSRDAASAAGWPVLAPVENVVSGWTGLLERASRLSIPDETLTHGVIAARSDLLLLGPVDPDDDPVGFLLDAGELVRCGDDADAWLPELVEPAETVARHLGERSTGPADAPVAESLDALGAVLRVATICGDQRAAADLRRIIDDLDVRLVDGDRALPVSFADLRRGASAGRFVRAVERRFVDVVSDRSGSTVERGAALLPGGLPDSWLGADFDVHGLPSVPGSSVSFAVRWHGERPAVLWEQAGPATRLQAPTMAANWSSGESKGEALWDAPARVPRRSIVAQAAVTDHSNESEPDRTDRRAAHGGGAAPVQPGSGEPGSFS